VKNRLVKKSRGRLREYTLVSKKFPFGPPLFESVNLFEFEFVEKQPILIIFEETGHQKI